MKEMAIKAILFDSGKVLNAPASENWFISPIFYKVVNLETFNQLSKKRIKEAFLQANEYIQSIKYIESTNEEFLHFKNFYKIFSSCLPELNLNQEEIELLANDLVYNPEKYIFYEDTFNVIPKLSTNYKLGIVSDAWPSLKNVYEYNGLYRYFDTFIISSLLGVTKPDKKMYQKSLDELKVLPSQVLFIDDNLVNVKGAMKLGINGILLSRNKWIYRWNKMIAIGKNYRVIHHLDELIDHEK